MKKTQLMCAYLLNSSVQFKSNCRFSAKKLPLPPGRCRKDFFFFHMVSLAAIECDQCIFFFSFWWCLWFFAMFLNDSLRNAQVWYDLELGSQIGLGKYINNYTSKCTLWYLCVKFRKNWQRDNSTNQLLKLLYLYEIAY